MLPLSNKGMQMKSTTTPRSGKRFMTLFGAIFALAGLLASKPLLITPLQKTEAAKTWNPVPATVLSSEVKSHSNSDGTTYSPHISYKYEINKQEYRGDQYSFMSGSSSGYDGKAAIVRQYPKGHQFTVFVNPANPSESVINRNKSPMLLFGLIPVIFFIVGIGIIIAAIRNKKATLDPAQARTQVVRLKGKSPIGKAVGIVILSTVWNTVVYFIIQSDAPAFFALIFGLFGLAMIAGSIHAILNLFNPRPTVEITPGDIRPGTNVAMRWRLSGRIDRIVSLNITLQCVEVTTETRRSGSKTTTSVIKTPIHTLELLASTSANEIAQGTLQFIIQNEQPPSRPGNTNGIQWQLLFHGDIPRWPDVKEEFHLIVYPET